MASSTITMESIEAQYKSNNNNLVDNIVAFFVQIGESVLNIEYE